MTQRPLEHLGVVLAAGSRDEPHGRALNFLVGDRAHVDVLSVAFAAELTASLKSAGIPVVATVDATSPINYASLGKQIKEGLDIILPGRFMQVCICQPLIFLLYGASVLLRSL